MNNRDDEVDYWAEQDAIEDMYKNELANHPNCKDPDHPGCGACQDD